jgi:hypothetical protein
LHLQVKRKQLKKREKICTASVDAESDGAEAGADDGGGATGGAAGDLVGVVRIPGGPARGRGPAGTVSVNGQPKEEKKGKYS